MWRGMWRPYLSKPAIKSLVFNFHRINWTMLANWYCHSIYTYQHGIFIGSIITSINDFYSLRPIHTESRSQNINGGSAFVPQHRRFCFDGTLCIRCIETEWFNDVACFFNQLMPSIGGCITVMECEQRTFVFNPCAILANLHPIYWLEFFFRLKFQIRL